MKHPCDDCRQNCKIPCWKVDHGLLVEPPRWISVKSRPPRSKEKVLAYKKNEADDAYAEMAIVWGWSCLENKRKITHWMPLPEPPKEDNQ